VDNKTGNYQCGSGLRSQPQARYKFYCKFWRRICKYIPLTHWFQSSLWHFEERKTISSNEKIWNK